MHNSLCDISLIRLLKTKSKGSSVYRHLPRFYADRAVRLTPALYLMVAVMTPIYLHHNYTRSSVIRYMFMALFYLTNIEYLWINGDQGIFSNTWSLACEEHFYILWSFTLPFVCRLSLRNRIAALAALFGISQFIRIYTSMYPGSFFGINYYFNSINNFWKMLMGASLRLLPVPPIFMKYQWAYLGSIGIFAMLGLVAYLPSEKLHLDKVAPGWQDHKAAARTWSDPIAAICTVLIICGVQDARGGPRFLESQFFRFIGKISYAWYLWQLPIMLNLGGLKSGNGIAYGSTAIAFMVAIVSTVYVEEPIRAAYVAWKARRSARDTLQHSHIP
jgi:peptidoglycan/LPS O-acetylase OafA/YrhL